MSFTRSFVSMLAVGLAGLAPAAAASPDPVVADVVRMLEERVADGVVLAYLDTERRRPAPLAPDTIIALTRAGASPAVVKKLMEMAEAPPSEVVPPAAVPPAAGATPAEGSGADRGTVEFELSFAAEKGERLDEPWDLYAYVDGEPLAWSTGRGGIVGTDTLRFTELLSAGSHRMALLLERHDTRAGGADRHEAIVCPEVVPFVVAAGTTQRLRVNVRESWALPLKGGGALSFTFTDAHGVVEARDNLGGDPDHWPHLCDEVEASVPPGKEPARAARRKLEGCRRWSDLWPAGAASRQEVRRALSEVDYRPVPAGAR